MPLSKMPTDFDATSGTAMALLDIMGGTSDFSGGLCLYYSSEKRELFSIEQQGIFERVEVPCPAGVEFWAINGGAVGSATAAIYDRARAATFMGRKIVGAIAPGALENISGERHLANLSADVWRAIRGLVPESIGGAQFIEVYGSHDDEKTRIEPNIEYRVRLATEHPIYENERTRKFVRFLELAESNPTARHAFLTAAGELMIQSHFSYDHRCNLGNERSDLLVQLAREAGKEAGIYGAKLSGNGDSTTIVLLCDRQKNVDIEGGINGIAAKYRESTAIEAKIFQGINQSV